MNQAKKHLTRNIIAIVTAIVFYALYRLAFLIPGFVETVYSRGFFKFINQLLSSLTGLVSFSIAEFVLYAFAVFVAVLILYTLLSVIVTPGKRFYRLICQIVALIAIAANIFVSFTVLWGFNYARQPLSQSMQLTVKPVDKQVLYEVCNDLVEKADSLRNSLPENGEGVFISQYKKEDILQKIPDLYKKVAKEKGLDYLGGNFGQAKPVLYSKGMSYAGLVGVYFPFTGEANLNTDMPALTFLAGACHEAAHQRGFAREDEANFLAYYICRESGDANFAYSGTVLALIYAVDALYDTDPELSADVRKQYSDALKRDIADYNAYWQEFEGPADKAVEAMNNTYLKANQQQDGVKSYGRMVDLLIALYQKEHAKSSENPKHV